MKRKPAVAGYFYPQQEESLKSLLDRMIDLNCEKRKSISVIVPHAGFEYSGTVAGAVFSSVQLPNVYVILGPNHRHVKSRFAIMKEGTWQTPLGEVPIDSGLANAIATRSDLISDDSNAHEREHSLEVQLPFIQYFKDDFSIVPISIAYQASYEELEELGHAISEAIQGQKEDVLIVASTDMSHYVDHQEAKIKDFLAIEEIKRLDAQGLYDVVSRENISMCGYQPTTATIVASKDLGGTQAELIKYQTSGEVTKNFHEVVGYAGIRIF
ncbi:MAG: AmmeMemoRadiSam system protein B [Candidatus Aminicenantaceae bacterium]